MRTQEEIESFVITGLRQMDVIVTMVQLSRDPEIGFEKLDMFCREFAEDIPDGLASIHLFNKDQQQKEILEKYFGEIVNAIKEVQDREEGPDLSDTYVHMPDSKIYFYDNDRNRFLNGRKNNTDKQE
jgi:hypothetical protein